MADIFISYSHEDSKYTNKLVEALEQKWFSVWIDQRIDTGDRWFKRITQEIRNCSTFLVIMTPDAEQSEWVEREILVAQKHNKPI